jgi:outer membrane lipoprotein-sorting protein
MDVSMREGTTLLRWAAVSTVALAGSVCAPNVAAAEEPDAQEIVDRSIEKHSFEFESGRTEMKLVVEGDDGDRSEKKMVSKTKLFDGEPRTLIELTHPEDLKGQSFLFARNEEGSDDVWMYVPAFEVTRRLEGSKKQGAFLGSHFTYADLESRDVQRADYKKKGEDEVGNHDVYVIEATPTSSEQSDYGSVELYVRKSDFVPLKFIFRDDSGDVIKRLLVTRVGSTDDGRKYLKQMKMKSRKEGYSVVTIESIEPDVDLPDSIFSKEQLGK